MTTSQPQSAPAVLIVDDEAANRKLLVQLVEREGFTALEASGGAEALALLESEEVDLVLLDLMMPETDGMTVLRSLHRQGRLPALPVVVVTAHDERDHRLEALSVGAIDFLAKPISHLEVTCKVRSLIELSRLRGRAAQLVAAEAERKQAARIDEALAGLPIIVYEVDVTDASHIVGKWVIGDVERHFGGSVAEFCSRLDWEDRVHSSDRVRVGQEIRQLVDGTTSHITSRFRVRVDGEYRWCLSTASYNPTTCGIRGVLVKIDEQVATEERLVLAQRMEAFGKLAGGVAHDFNNILAVVLSFAEFVRDALPEHDELREDIIEVLNAADRGAGMTRRLLAFARQLPDEKKPVDLNLILTQMHSLLASTLGERIELVIIPSARPAVVLIDPVSFDQILINLAVNARDAMPRGGRLSITLEVSPHANPDQPEQRVARLLVADTGLGMEEGVLARIFEPFSTTKAFGKGTGIGLATCFGIVTAANGSIEVESVIGRGTTFTVTFPLTDQSVHTWDSASRPTTRAAHGERVLVVEDEPILRRVTGRVLENAGYTVHLAADGPEAFRLLDTLGSSLALILTDIVLPGASGYEVADHAARSAPTAIVLLTSGYLDESLRNEHKPLPVLWKPVRPVELIRAVAEALAARRAGKPASVGPRPDDHRAATFASAKTPRPLSSHRIALPRQSPLSLPSFLSCAENASSSSMTMSLWLVGPNASCRAAAMRSSSPAQWTPHATRSTRVSSTPWSPT